MTYTINKINKVNLLEHHKTIAEVKLMIYEQFLRGELEVSLGDLKELENEIMQYSKMIEAEINQ